MLIAAGQLRSLDTEVENNPMHSRQVDDFLEKIFKQGTRLFTLP